MLSCRDINKQVSDYQHQQLSFARRLQFALHLLMCGKCRAFVKQMLTAVKVYKGLDRDCCPPLADDEARQMSDDIIALASQKPDEESSGK